jgi:hypothetical protein
MMGLVNTPSPDTMAAAVMKAAAVTAKAFRD